MNLITELLQFLGLVNIYAPCPSPYDISPCKCTSYLRLVCESPYDGTFTYDDIGQVINATHFQTLNFDFLELMSVPSKSLNKNYFGDLTFKDITIFSHHLQEMDFYESFKRSIDSLERVTMRFNNEVDLKNIDGLRHFKNLQSIQIEGIKRMESLPILQASNIYNFEVLNCQVMKFPIETFVNSSNLKYLSLVGNHLTEDQISSKRFASCVNLEQLLLGRNNISRLRTDSFGFLPALQTLSLNYNSNLSVIEPGVFEQMPKLFQLNLRGNRGLKTLSSGIFRGLGQKFISLELGQSPISSIDVDVFSDFQTSRVSLSNTNLKTIEESWARNLFERKNELMFYYNTYIICDCRIAWMVENGYNNKSGVADIGCSNNGYKISELGKYFIDNCDA